MNRWPARGRERIPFVRLLRPHKKGAVACAPETRGETNALQPACRTHPACFFKGTPLGAVSRCRIECYAASWPAETPAVKCRFCGVWPVRRLLTSRTRHGPARGHGLKATGLRVRKQLTLNQGKQPRFGRFG